MAKNELKKCSTTRKAPAEVVESVEAELYTRVRGYIAKARAKVYAAANKEMVLAYWNVGREIVEKQGGATHAKYGDGLLKGLSLKLTAEFGPGYAGASLRYMRLVYLAFPNCHTLCDKLNWSHYRLLATILRSALSLARNETRPSFVIRSTKMSVISLQSATTFICRRRKNWRSNFNASGLQSKKRSVCVISESWSVQRNVAGR